MAAADTSTRERRGGRPSREEAAALTRRIVDTATDLFLRHGFEKTSMDMVSAEAGISKPTIYARFANKAELFEAAVMELAQRKMDELEAIVVSADGTRRRLHDLARQLLDIMIDPQVIALERIVAGEAHQFPDLAHRMYLEGGERVTAITANLLRQLDAYAGRPDEAVRLDAQILFGLIVLPPLRRAMLESAGEPVDGALLDRAIDIFVAGAMGEGPDRFSPPRPVPAP